MLEEENKIKPEETKLITGVVKTWSAEAVADCIYARHFAWRPPPSPRERQSP